eukprot:517579-Ditylum_brightwellii.AAC.1
MECMEPSNLLANAATSATGAKTFYNYNISTDYPVPENKDRFNMRQCFSRLMKELLRLDQDMIVGSNINEENNWTTTKDLPTGDTCNEVFSVKQEMRNDKPLVIMYGTLKSTWKWKDLEGDKGIFCYIKQQNIFLCINKFDTEKTGIAGQVLKLHRTLVSKKELAQELKINLISVKIEEDRAVEKWKAANPAPPEGGSSSIGNQGKKKDSVYLKCLLAAGWEQGVFDRGLFVPYGIHTTEGPTFLKNLLREHNEYIKEIKCIAVEGISEGTIWSKAPLEDDAETTIFNYFCLEAHDIESAERT